MMAHVTLENKIPIGLEKEYLICVLRNPAFGGPRQDPTVAAGVSVYDLLDLGRQFQ